MSDTTLKYRPAIDGLRAIAVLSVFFFHLDRSWLPGGFVGVDVFFVISGYLITSLLLKDLLGGTFSLGKFYQRRIARIFPASLLVGVVTLAAAALLYSPDDLSATGSALAAATLSVANVKFMLQGNYFTFSADAQPLLHYWSLSVEEQFYMVFPLLLLLLVRHARRQLPLVLGALWIASLAACVWMTAARPVWAFYLLPTRAWELLTGALLAVNAGWLARGAEAPWRRWLPGLGLALVALSFAVVREGDHFPGLWALLPVAGTALVVLPVGGRGGRVEALLSAAPMVLVGQLSYSLYLWHWPVFCFTDYALYSAPEALRLAVKVALSVPLSWLTFKLVEGPTRIALSRPTAVRPAYAFLALSLVIFVPVGVAVRRTHFIDATPAQVAAGGHVYDYGSRGGSVVLMGDSYGSMYATTLKEICRIQGCKLTVISSVNGDPLPALDGTHNQLWRDSLAVVQRERPTHLLLAYHWDARLRGARDRATLALEELSRHAGHIVLLNQAPVLPPTATREAIRRGARPPFLEDPETRRIRQDTNRYLETLRSDAVAVLDVASRFETESGEIRVWDPQGRELYLDKDHLGGFGAAWVRPELERVVGQGTDGRLAGR